MLKLILPRFEDLEPIELDFEHSLVSMSKWEAIHEKPFFSKDPQTTDETKDYIVHMLRSIYPPEHLRARITHEHILEVQTYINSKQTATTFREDPNQPKSREVITSDLVYYWLTAFTIPFSPVEDWHFNRLMTLIRIHGIKQSKPRKMTRQQQAEENQRLNALRREQLGTSG